MSIADDTPGEFVEVHIECPLCGSSDAFCRRADGSGKCFSCEGNTPATGAPETAVINNPPSDISSELLDSYNRGSLIPLKARAITLATCKHFGYRVRKNHKGEWEHLAPYWDKHNHLAAIHVRNVGRAGSDKRFYTEGNPSKIGLFGSRTWEKGGKMFIITAGQIDALTVSQAFGNNYSVASLPGGDGSVKAIAKHLELLSNFEKIVLWFDDDDPSKKALDEAVRIIPPGKAYCVDSPFKDANEMLMSGADYKDITKLCWNAKPYRPDGIVDIKDLRERLLKEPEMGTSWGKNFEWLDEWTYGRKPGQIIFFGGGTGSGKTVIIDQIICNTILPPVSQPLGIFSWERTAEEMGRAIIGRYAEKLFHIPQGDLDPEDRDWTSNELVDAIDRFYDESCALLINDSYGAADWLTVKERIRSMVHVDGVKHIILDPITALAASLGDRNQVSELDKLIADVALTTKELGITTIAVSHLATPADGKSHEEGASVRSNQFRGSRAIMFWATGMFGWERNQQADNEHDKLVGTFRCLKDRFTGRATGNTKKLEYDLATGMYSPRDYSDIGPSIGPHTGDDHAD